MRIHLIDMRTEKRYGANTKKIYDVTRFGITRTAGDDADFNAFIAREKLVYDENEGFYKRETPLEIA